MLLRLQLGMFSWRIPTQLKLLFSMASFLHEPLQHIYSFDSFENSCTHKCHNRMAFFFHELLQHIYLCHSFDNTCRHKCHIWMASFPHELMQHNLDSRLGMFSSRIPTQLKLLASTTSHTMPIPCWYFKKILDCQLFKCPWKIYHSPHF